MTQLVQMRPPTGITQANGKTGSYYAADNAGLISVLPQDVTSFLDAGWSIEPSIYTTVVILQSEDIASLVDGIEVVTAQGTGTVIVPVFASLQYNVGTQPFNSAPMYVLINIGTESILNYYGSMFNGIDNIFSLFVHDASQGSILSELDNQPIKLLTNGNVNYTGSILTSSINAPGSGYTAGDTITIGNALITVDTEDSGGVVEYTITDAGSGFIVDTYAQDSSSGLGTGFVLSVDSITPLSNGTAKLTIQWSVIQV